MKSDVFHFPPDLFELLVQVIPVLNRSKKSVLLFFKGAGVNESKYNDLAAKLRTDKDSINKFEIARTILERINEDSDKYLRQRREIIKRVTEFESFSQCWESDQYKAKGLVAEVQKIVNVKDSFTRMKQERDNEQKKKSQEHKNKVEALLQRQSERESIKKDLSALFSSENPQKRGILLEKVLNSFFKTYNILVRENFQRTGSAGEGILEQIDGIIELDHQIYLTEMKWKKESIGSDDIYAHLGRIYHRSNAHGIFISASGYSPSGIEAAKEALQKNALLILFDLEELYLTMDRESDFNQYLRDKVKAAIIDKNPFKKFTST
ncbi:MAG: restriction endonuclease [Roseivirga sp.]